jgi:tRNA threonylcarbamoyladenosine biosynthesis protein TsaE
MPDRIRWRLPDAEATEAAGRVLATVLAVGDVIALVGELGAGKTTLVRGLAIGLGVDGADVASPTFALCHEYRGRIAVCHLDLYRIERARELDHIDFDGVLDRHDSAAVIEWADRFIDRLPSDHVRVDLAYEGDARVLIASGTGPRGRALVAAWTAAVNDDDTG